jgi:hypothetical protein
VGWIAGAGRLRRHVFGLALTRSAQCSIADDPLYERLCVAALVLREQLTVRIALVRLPRRALDFRALDLGKPERSQWRREHAGGRASRRLPGQANERDERSQHENNRNDRAPLLTHESKQQAARSSKTLN